MSESVNDVDKKRSVFSDLNNKGVDIKKQLVGFLGFFIVFVVCIPYYLIKAGRIKTLEAYVPNFDLIATVLGYGQGPLGLGFFKYLYNPAVVTLYGYWSSQIINYMALLGVTYVIAYYTHKTKNIMKGWSRSFFMLLITYLLPGNFIAELMFKIGNKIDKYAPKEEMLHNYIMYGLGGLIVALIIATEEHVIEAFSEPLVSVLENIKRVIV
tara:strand:- start:180 stop:812 length:633 start_codon:yes stop_codon:yes gene_type:complete